MNSVSEMNFHVLLITYMYLNQISFSGASVSDFEVEPWQQEYIPIFNFWRKLYKKYNYQSEGYMRTRFETWIVNFREVRNEII